MNEIVIPSMYLLAGVCAYASFTHLFAGLRRSFDLAQIVFAGMSLVIILVALSHTRAFRAGDIGEFVAALKWELAFILMFFLSFIWFIALYTGKRPQPLLAGLSLLFAVLFLVNFLQPYSVQYDHISGIRHLRLPWGEVITLAEGRNSGWFHVAIIGVFTVFGYALHALASVYRRDRNRHALGMMLAIGFFMVVVMQGILVRLSIVDFAPLGTVGFLGLIIMMSVILIHQRHAESRKKSAALQLQSSIADNAAQGIVLNRPADGVIVHTNRHFDEMFGYGPGELVGKHISVVNAPTDTTPQETADKIIEALKRDGAWNGELQNQKKDGAVFWTFAHVSTFQHPEHETLWVTYQADITERKRAEMALAEREEQLRGRLKITCTIQSRLTLAQCDCFEKVVQLIF